jgi:hypothetical protein
MADVAADMQKAAVAQLETRVGLSLPTVEAALAGQRLP